MAQYSFKLPDLGEGTVESEIVEWRVKPGDSVDAEAPLVDMMTDKATVEITAPVTGRVVSLAGNPGDMIAVGSELVVFETGDGAEAAADTGLAGNEDTPSAPPAAGADAGSPSPGAGVQPGDRAAAGKAPATQRPLTSPAVRRRAKDAGVDLNEVPGSGPKGRIRQKDLDAYLGGESGDREGLRPATAGGSERAAGGRTGPGAHARRTGTEEIQVIGLRRKIAEKMAESKRRIPHFVYTEDMDVTELGALRDHLNGRRGSGQPKLSWLPFFMRALVRVIDDFPQVNAHFDDEKNIITRHAPVHIGIATQTDNGLMVPVVKHAESLDLWDSAAELARVAEAARSGKAKKEELTGSTITITSLGKLAGVSTGPVINHPEVAIISINKAEQRPVCRDGQIVARLMMTVSAAFDHRVVDGYDAARMIQAMKALLEHPAAIFI